MKLMERFTSITRVGLRDCFIENDMAYFIVDKGNIGKAIGKNGSNVIRLEKIFNRKIKIVEFNSDLLQFIRNVAFPLKIKEIEAEDGRITISAVDLKTRGLLIGRAAKNLRNMESIIRRYFDIKEIRVS